MHKTILLILLILSGIVQAQEHENIEFESSLYSHWADIYDVAVSGDYAFIAAGYSGLQVMDVSDPHDPQYVAAWDANPIEARHVIIEGNLAFVSDNEYGFNIVDISDTQNPFEIGGIEEDARIFDMNINGNFLYIAGIFEENSGMYIFNISNPEEPNEIAYCEESHSARNISVYDNFVYVSGYNSDEETSSLFIYNVSDPANPEYLGDFDFNGSEREFIALGDVAYLRISNREVNGFYILDISERDNPETISIFDDGIGFVLKLEVVGDLLYLQDRDENSRELIVVFDISNPREPTEVSRMDHDVGWGNMSIFGDHVYLESNDELIIVDFSDFENPQAVGTYSNKGISIEGVATFGDYAYVSQSDGMLFIHDISDPLEPELITSCRNLRCTDVKAHDDKIYANLNGGFGILDISDPVDPRRLGSFIVGHS